jgi:hypothetical protein
MKQRKINSVIKIKESRRFAVALLIYADVQGVKIIAKFAKKRV